MVGVYKTYLFLILSYMMYMQSTPSPPICLRPILILSFPHGPCSFEEAPE